MDVMNTNFNLKRQKRFQSTLSMVGKCAHPLPSFNQLREFEHLSSDGTYFGSENCYTNSKFVDKRFKYRHSLKKILFFTFFLLNFLISQVKKSKNIFSDISLVIGKIPCLREIGNPKKLVLTYYICILKKLGSCELEDY